MEVQFGKNYITFFFYREKLELLQKQRKINAEAKPKMEKKYLLNNYREYIFCLQSNASGSFCKHVLIL